MADESKRFMVGKWRVEPEAGQMTDGGDVVLVPPRLMHLLELLVGDAGKTISREDLIQTLWPRGYVNEEALSRAVNELRSLLGDNARNPEFIKTIPKRGYRLIARTGPESQPGPESSANKQSWKPLWALTGVVVVGALLFLLLKTDEPSLPADILSTATRLTSDPGMEWQPELSANGEWVAQVVSSDGAGTIELFPTAAPEQKRQIRYPGGLYSPAFSPDSSQLATMSGRGEDCQVILWPVAGPDFSNAESAETIGPCYRLSGISGLDWSGDGHWLAIPTRDPDSGALVISRLRLSDGKVFPVTRLTDPYQSDERPRFSPDGQWLSFSRGTRAVRELWLLDLSQSELEPRQLTRDGQFTTGHDWWPDSRTIVMDSDRRGHRALWRLNLQGEILLLGARDAQLPSVSNDGTILFQDAQYEANIWSLDASDGSLDSKALISSTKYDSMPAWSPDGREIAFSSNRTGDGGIWIAASDGSRVRLVYEPENGRAIGPAWLNDGSALLATEYTPDSQRIVRIALNRREVIPFQIPGSHPYSPTESPDRQSIYYLAGDENRGAHLWRMDVSGAGGHERVLQGPLLLYQVTDGGFIYYTRFREPGLWRTRVEYREESELVMENLPTWAGEDWEIQGEWVYFATVDGIDRLHLEKGTREKVTAVVPYSLGPSFAIHPDGTLILVSKTDRAESDLFLARPESD